MLQGLGEINGNWVRKENSIYALDSYLCLNKINNCEKWRYDT